MEIVALRKKRIAYMEHENTLRTFPSTVNSPNPLNFLRRTFNSGITNQITLSCNNISLIKQDISTYEEIYSQLYNDYVDLQVIQERIEYSKTFKGQYYHVLGHFFSLYCIWKIFISFINITFNRVGKGIFT